jgi:hypothetical protein
MMWIQWIINIKVTGSVLYPLRRTWLAPIINNKRQDDSYLVIPKK